VELDQFVTDIDSLSSRRILQGLQITSAKLTVRVIGARQVFFKLEQSPAVTLQVLLVLRVHCSKLPILAVLAEGW
jgi:hypothetical protein